MKQIPSTSAERRASQFIVLKRWSRNIKKDENNYKPLENIHFSGFLWLYHITQREYTASHKTSIHQKRHLLASEARYHLKQNTPLFGQRWNDSCCHWSSQGEALHHQAIFTSPGQGHWAALSPGSAALSPWHLNPLTSSAEHSCLFTRRDSSTKQLWANHFLIS